MERPKAAVQPQTVDSLLVGISKREDTSWEVTEYGLLSCPHVSMQKKNTSIEYMLHLIDCGYIWTNLTKSGASHEYFS